MHGAADRALPADRAGSSEGSGPALRLLLFDRTCINRAGVGLSRIWQGGSLLYRALGRTHLAHAAESWAQALDFVCRVEPGRPIREVQFWGHGKWGQLFIGRDRLDRSALSPGHARHPALLELRTRLSPGALFWFRTCETFGARAGHDFACAWTEFFGQPAAGHTHVIGYWQSGLHRLEPGARPSWSASEGLLRGSAEHPEQALTSGPHRPNTISCLTGQVPDAF